ncbi:hypothetical protein [Comamonas odontotermitis]|uniref:hypothetical protein n=1 Tax=Comamonas odontotermitis TaxID=379895 RepID=UPI001CC7CB7D|nr:hypothetical protein [Comamonas odontotermitis]UBB15406.1 hypothetical protein LAD35_11025 [Comamonas odontotermitis]
MDERSNISIPVAKLISVWVAFGITSWEKAAAAAAFLYSALLICEWFWKKVWRPVFERAGWIKPRPPRRSRDGETDWGKP